ncbi:hypothetical protein evm_001625 [Chilo suppressalis]|nr:hypothetical protein evm_001625 [Chilo suppressalis]
MKVDKSKHHIIKNILLETGSILGSEEGVLIYAIYKLRVTAAFLNRSRTQENENTTLSSKCDPSVNVCDVPNYRALCDSETPLVCIPSKLCLFILARYKKISLTRSPCPLLFVPQYHCDLCVLLSLCTLGSVRLLPLCMSPYLRRPFSSLSFCSFADIQYRNRRVSERAYRVNARFYDNSSSYFWDLLLTHLRVISIAWAMI